MSTRMTDELRSALDQIFSIWSSIDLAFSLPGGAWIRPDATAGKHRRLAGLDRHAVEALQRQLWARSLAGGCGIHWRPACADWRPEGVDAGAGWTFASHALLDDLDGSTVLGILAKYRAVGIETSAGSYQVVVATSRGLTRLEQHQVQAALVQRLLASGHHADPGATGAGQYARLPGFPHPLHGGRTVGLLGSSQPLPLLDPDDLLLDGPVTPKPAKASARGAGRRLASSCSRPRVPARRASGGRGKAAEGGPADRAGGSERDYGWACGQIRAGVDPEALVDRLADAAMKRGKRRDEVSARDYARRTIYKAQAALAR
ncbi:MAG: DNA-primase RepB domain-containing protein [Rhodospirillales bacterium]|nr:DNA-primase RepB domain-containing protein [Rhodospirillales bacterium]